MFFAKLRILHLYMGVCISGPIDFFWYHWNIYANLCAVNTSYFCPVLVLPDPTNLKNGSGSFSWKNGDPYTYCTSIYHLFQSKPNLTFIFSWWGICLAKSLRLSRPWATAFRFPSFTSSSTKNQSYKNIIIL